MAGGYTSFRGGEVSRARRLVAGMLVLTALVIGPAAGRLETDNRLERWAGDDARLARDYAAFVEQYGSDEFVLVAVGGTRLLEAEVLDRMLAAVEAFEKLRDVRDRKSVV